MVEVKLAIVFVVVVGFGDNDKVLVSSAVVVGVVLG